MPTCNCKEMWCLCCTLICISQQELMPFFRGFNLVWISDTDQKYISKLDQSWQIKVEHDKENIFKERIQERLNCSLFSLVTMYDLSHAHTLRSLCNYWPRNKPAEHGTDTISDRECVCLCECAQVACCYAGVPKAERLWPASCTHTHTQADSQHMEEGSWEAARLLTAEGKIA